MRTLKINRQDFALSFGFLLLALVLASTILYPQTNEADLNEIVLQAVYMTQNGGGSFY